MAILKIIKGHSSGKEFNFDTTQTIGRSLDANIRLNDQALSRIHAVVRRNDLGEYIIEDLRSHNGTYVNKKHVKESVLHSGDVIQVGQFLLTFYNPSELEEPPATETQLDVMNDDGRTRVVDTVSFHHDCNLSEKTGTTLLDGAAPEYGDVCNLINLFQKLDIALDEKRLLQHILETLMDVFSDTDRGLIILRDTQTGKLSPAVAKSKVHGNLDMGKISLSSVLMRYVLVEKQAVHSKDVWHDERFKGSESMAKGDFRSIMCAPLVHIDEVLGFILLDSHLVTPSYNKQSLGMLASIANVASLVIANARLHRDQLKQERLKQDLANARKIQLSFLPQNGPQIPGFEFANWYDTAYDVGGDFYDFLELPDGNLGIAVGDVSGKGISAALMMAKITTSIRTLAVRDMPPSEMLERLNYNLVQEKSDLFVTLVYIVLDIQSKIATFANAGHFNPMLRNHKGKTIEVEFEASLPIGVLENQSYKQTDVRVNRGDILFLYTDGIVEAMDVDKNLFGRQKLLKTIKNTRALSPPNAMDRIKGDLLSFVGDQEQHDDITVVAFGPPNREVKYG